MGLTATWGRGARSGPPRLLVLLSLTVWARECHGGQTYNPTTGHYDLCSTIQETDGSPAVLGCNTLAVSNGTLTDNGDGTYAWNVAGAPVGGFPTTRLLYGNGTATPTTSASFLFDGTNLTLPSTGDLRPSANATDALNIANAAGTDFVTFDTTNSRVGIGTTSPQNLLDVSNTGTSISAIPNIRLVTTGNGGTQYGPGIFFDGTSFTSGRKWEILSNGPSDGSGGVGKFAVYDNTAGQTRFIIDSSGNIGLGTTNPGYALHVFGSATTDGITYRMPGTTQLGIVSQIENSAGSGVFDARYYGSTAAGTIGGLTAANSVNLVAQPGANHFGLGTFTNFPMVFWTNSLERMRIAAGGDINVGVARPSSIDSALVGLFSDSITSNLNLALSMAVTGAGGQTISFYKARGTHAAPTIVANGDSVWDMVGWQYDGAQYNRSARILAQVDGTPGSLDSPGRLTFWTTLDGASSMTERMRLDNAGVLNIGSTSYETTTGLKVANGGLVLANVPINVDVTNDIAQIFTGSLTVAHNESTVDPVILVGYGGYAGGPTLNFAHTRSTGTDANTIVQNGDNLGDILWYGADGANYRNAAQILAAVDGTPAVNDMPSRLVFGTKPGGSAQNITERLRIDSAGGIQIGSGGTTPGKARLALKGGTATATTDWALTSGWGANATISAVTGNDSRGTVTVTTSALDTPTANPVLTLTFKDGTWTSTPFPMANMDHVSTGPSTVPVTCRATATTLVLSYRGTPTATSALTYTFNYLAEG